MRIRILIIITVMLSTGLFHAYAQNGKVTVRLPDSLLYRLPVDSLWIPASEDTVSLDSLLFFTNTLKVYYGKFQLKKNLHYRLNTQPVQLIFLQKFPTEGRFKLVYRPIPFPVIPSANYLVPLPRKKDSLTSGTGPRPSFIKQLEKAFSEETPEIEKNGTFVRGFQVGSNQNLTLNSSLNLFLKGKISDHTSITAALTDENTPIQPEGNTQTLNEIDKVYIQLESPWLKGTMGDFDFIQKGNEYETIQRKLQGIWLKGLSPYGTLSGILASKRGNYHHNAFAGQEGNQGPYLLTGKNGERNILILAGTERVYVNGVLKKRGENLDYVIDYSTGELTFTSRFLVSSDSRIEVDFEYLDITQRYAKNFYQLKYIMPEHAPVRFGAAFYQEKDDINNLLADSDPLTDAEKGILRAAGDSIELAAKSGATFVGLPNGNYIQADTTINGQLYSYFKYQAGAGDYTVRFSSTEAGKGSYIRQALGHYVFVGPGRGNYEPIIRIPLPASHSVGVFSLQSGSPDKQFVNADLAVSRKDNNFLSPLDDGDNQALSSKISFKANRQVAVGRKKLALQWGGYWGYKEAAFSTLDRYYKADYNRYWNIKSAGTGSENTLESNLLIQLPGVGSYRINGGDLKVSGLTHTRRYMHGLDMKIRKWVQQAHFEFVKTRAGNAVFYWQRHRGSLGYEWSKSRFMTIGTAYEYKQDRQNGNINGFRNRSWTARQRWQFSRAFTEYVDMLFKTDYLFQPEKAGAELRQATVFQMENGFLLTGRRNFRSELVFNFRNKNYTDAFEALNASKNQLFKLDPLYQDTSWVDRKSYSMSWKSNWRLLNNQLNQRWEYLIASELTAIQEKVYVKVENNMGNYRFDESLNEYVPDSNGDYILVIIPSGNYTPTSKILVNWQLDWRPSRAIKKKKWIHRIMVLNRINIDEKTTHDNLLDLYFLNLSVFQKEGETIRGKFSWSNDVSFFPNHPVWNVRLQSRYIRQLINVYLQKADNEQRIIREQSLILRRRSSSHFRQELETGWNTTERNAPLAGYKNRDIRGVKGATRFLFRVVSGVENLTEIFYKRELDRQQSGNLQSGWWKFTEKITATFMQKGRLTSEFKMYNVKVLDNPQNRPFPYEMAEGKKPGNSYEWMIRADYSVSNNLSFSLDYRGRSEPLFPRTIHTGRMELRALF